MVFSESKGEGARRGQGPGPAALVAAEDRLACVLVHDQTVSRRDLADTVHVADQPRQVHDKDRPRALGDAGLHGLGIDDHGAGRCVREDGDVGRR